MSEHILEEVDMTKLDVVLQSARLDLHKPKDD